MQLLSFNIEAVFYNETDNKFYLIKGSPLNMWLNHWFEINFAKFSHLVILVVVVGVVLYKIQLSWVEL